MEILEPILHVDVHELPHVLQPIRAFHHQVYDAESGKIFAARDHMGISSMYIGYGKDGSVWFASEMKVRVYSWVLFRLFVTVAGLSLVAGV
jgi:asparagine synthase (glutamine-hydrolysing)